MKELITKTDLDLKLYEIAQELKQKYSLSCLIIEQPYDSKTIYLNIMKNEVTDNIIESIINKLKEDLKVNLRCDFNPCYSGTYAPGVDILNDPNANCTYGLDIE